MTDHGRESNTLVWRGSGRLVRVKWVAMAKKNGKAGLAVGTDSLGVLVLGMNVEMLRAVRDTVDALLNLARPQNNAAKLRASSLH